MNWGVIFRSLKYDEMRNKIGILLLLIVVYRVLSHIPVPFAEGEDIRSLISTALSSDGIASFFNLFSGGALANFSIVIVGLGPYITASIILQLLVKVIPTLEEISKDGEGGRRKINQYTRYLTLPLAVIQSVATVLLLQNQVTANTGTDIGANLSIFGWIVILSSLVGGAMLLMWLGELMTEQGIGNGISILIFAGIISQLPSVVSTIISSINTSFEGDQSTSIFGWFDVPFDAQIVAIIASLILGTLLATFWVVKLNEAQRVITVSYAKRVQGNRSYGGVDSVLPIKLIIAGVIPVIFAFAFLMIPAFLGQLLLGYDPGTTLYSVGEFLSNVFGGILNPAYTATQAWWYFVGYAAFLFALVVGFTYFYASFTFNAKDIAENLQNQGGFIAGIRPGEQTEKYLKGVVNKLNLFGASSLGLLAVLPFIFQRVAQTQSLTIGGTGLLIVVSVAIETLRQIESKALMITYDAPTSGAKK